GGDADDVVSYGRRNDTALVGDWNGDGVDSLGVRRPSAPTAPRTIGSGTHVVGTDVAPGTYRAPGGSSCYWERLSGFSGELDDVLANGFADRLPIVTIRSS
ncbi:hypothetical protein PU560_00395, partial [Georgenia sp. 10Sc9-8]|nr:hypothetical protein [Georgenia halotolerans]